MVKTLDKSNSNKSSGSKSNKTRESTPKKTKELAPKKTKDLPEKKNKEQSAKKTKASSSNKSKESTPRKTKDVPVKKNKESSTKKTKDSISKKTKDIPAKKDNKNNNVKKDNRILEVKTTQTGAIKQVIERISNFISDCCIVFIPPDESCNDNNDEDYYEEIDEDDINPKKNKKDDSDSDDSSDDSSSEDEVPIKKKKITKSKKIIDDDSDEEEVPIKKKNTKSKKIINDDSDEDEDSQTHKKNNKNNSKNNKGGIRILRLTEDKSILVKVNLDSINFEHFRCDEPKITIGVDMHNLHSQLKMINDDDPIIMYMNRDNRSTLYIRSLNEGNESSEETDIEVFLMEIGNSELPIPKTKFQNRITMASDKFHNICKKLNNNSVSVEITSVGNEIKFRGQNESGKVTMSYKDTNYNSNKKSDSDQIVQGMYELRNLMGFSKCNKLCPTIDIYLKNDFPLVLVIGVQTLGKMYVFLSPIENPAN